MKGSDPKNFAKDHYPTRLGAMQMVRPSNRSSGTPVIGGRNTVQSGVPPEPRIPTAHRMLRRIRATTIRPIGRPHP
ncbi:MULTISPECIES: hypothetical protein [Xanthomonas]|uniref:Uncharacterized protein n=1 Tax=Xanthomonas dyei TaxID=743699 RepID=A0ABZ0DAS2_9XANT|nr:hypothetical protein [Xanthomonas dyei]MCC4635520.1 hypothetical protein [Xanthomonas dyei pv. eucalypti]WOB25413.1 hypothetical protein NYR99_16960 [Xanthomonas dyei]WOB53039.1 hypothetical protein NYR95_16965 [Xanthomonas dyei]